ncbi:MAG: hypothetical protein HDS88_05730 [Bacteroidales bacterium]|nr:hypothetical protein [Bacteroidales bacterium]
MKKVSLLAGLASLVALMGCNDNKGGVVDVATTSPLAIVRVDSYLMDNDVTSLPDSMTEAEQFLDYIVNRSITGDTNVVEQYKSSRAFQIFAPDVKSRFLQQDSLEQVMGVIDARLKELSGREKGLGHLYGIINPYNVPVVTTDSTVMIGLNHYLGTDYPGYAGFEDYKIRAKRAAHLPYDVAEARIVADNPFRSVSDPTLISRMIYWGAVANYVEAVVPDADQRELFNLTDSELEWLGNNSEKVWNRMIEQQMIYSTNPDIADRILYPAPKSFIINGDAPGMTGRYIGYLIVKSYLKNNPEATLQQMLSSELYNDENTLINSEFSGK